MLSLSCEMYRFPYPRRRVVRQILHTLSVLAFGILADVRIEGREHMPTRGPLLVVANHFSFLDPALMVRVSPWPLEFMGGFRMPNAPQSVTWIPKLWGFLPVHRGAASRDALRAAEDVLRQDGILGIYPEAGSWASVLRPARPGAAFLALRTGARILPMGFDGLTDLFSRLRTGKRGHVTVRIGEPFGPFEHGGKGPQRRRYLEEIGHEIMGRIAALIPAERRGHYSDDPTIRAAAEGTEVYPWTDSPDI